MNAAIVQRLRTFAKRLGARIVVSNGVTYFQSGGCKEVLRNEAGALKTIEVHTGNHPLYADALCEYLGEIIWLPKP